MAEGRQTGVYNATGPEYRLTFGDVLEACRVVTGSGATFAWAREDFLQEHEVAPWSDLPLWLPAELIGMSQANVNRAIAAGLTFRPLADTVRDTLDWANSRPADYVWRAGLTPEREAQLLRLLGEA
jgi:2'-hydroxyisoflavone reductase